MRGFFLLAAAPAVEWKVVELDACATDLMTAAADSLTWLVSHGLAGESGPAATVPGGHRAATMCAAARCRGPTTVRAGH